MSRFNNTMIAFLLYLCIIKIYYNNQMKTLLISFILLLPVAAAAQTDTQRQKDSLRTAIARSAGKEKLDNQLKLSLLYFPEMADDKKMDTLLTLLREMYDEAVRQGDIEKQGASLANTLIALFNKGNYDEIIRLAPDYMKKTDKPEAERFHYIIFNTYFKAYLAKGDDNTALAEAQQMYDRAQKNNDKYGMATALFCMSDMYGRQERCDEQEKYLRQSIDLWKTLGDKTLGKLTEACFQLCMSLRGQQRYDEALITAAEFEKTVSRYEEYTKAEQLTSRHNLYTAYMMIYMDKKDFDRAEIYCNKIDNIPFGRESEFLVVKARAQIFNARKQYDKALQMTDSAMTFTVTAAEQNIVRGIKMQILADMRGAGDVYNLANEYLKVQDSIHTATYNKNLDELRTQYEVDKITAQKERNRNYFLFALGGCILLLLVLAIWIYYSRQIERKNRTLAQQIKALTAHQEASDNEMLAKTSFITEGKREENAEDGVYPESRMDKLCIAIRDALLKNKIYRNSALTRDMLVERLGTNRELFVKAFQYCFAISFTDYINNLRLKDAVTLLEQSDLSVEEISEKIGFGTVRTFQRQFLAKHNLTPQNYRKMVNM